MPRPKKRDSGRITEVGGTVVGAVAAGVSLADAARRAGISERTLYNWLKRGEHEPDSTYGMFAAAVAAARDHSTQAPPMTDDALRVAVSRAARAGSIQAMRLYWEMLHADTGDEEAPDDPLLALDELARWRRANPSGAR